MRQLKITKQITNRDAKSLEKYFQEISKIDLITADEEVELAKRIREGDQKALDKLVSANLRFVVSAAKQYQNRGLRLTDLINEGNFGLVKAAKRFDETRGFKFISYAVWWIRQSILQALSKKSRVIRLPQNKIAVNSKIYQVYSSLEQTYQRAPSPTEIASELDISVSKVKSSIKTSVKHVSLDAPFKEGESSSLYNVLESKKLDSPDKEVMSESLEMDIDQALNKISERQGDVLRLFFGLGNQPPMSLIEIGEVFDVTRERVRQIKDKGLRALRRKSNTEVLRAYL
ncbi:RNA polymerase sigma factor RpoD/SigA [Maribacter sp. ACAM166]|uniref:sigma-70 family RNA polymerase sigma factor n=1 Tax=Maribacter sp. ACAM166 TaxID=2508996 RepID=UPI0010FE7C3F|nr:sigma-70 family RNA polymerase sigma factor [Maribacter sp. ACAM166]TLP82822.1 sigma-70 family RNA polymerase sigma factor [Maribacter sp. ACAM166]